jgi:hypothetical protein
VPILELLDYTGVAVFAATGALSASRKQLDIIGFLFLAAATGIGGGTFRDVILGATPVFWVVNPTYLIVCVVVALTVFVLAHRIESRYRLLLWLDAMGVSAYCVMGAAKGLAATGSPTVAITTGVLTASFGGILRDLLAGRALRAAAAGNLHHRGADRRGRLHGGERSGRTSLDRVRHRHRRRLHRARRGAALRLVLSGLQAAAGAASGRRDVRRNPAIRPSSGAGG